MVELVARWDGSRQGFFPSTRFDLDACAPIKSRREGRLVFTFSRSVQLNRWYRGLVGIVADALDVSPGVLHAELKFEAGLIENVFSSPKFGVCVSLESTAFAAMDETRFVAYTKMAVEIIFKKYLPGVKRKQVFDEVEKMVGPRPW